ncbi:hypothetical protein BV898_16068 [Hypsibius exemplaris]|uniref:Uncharacterized protein n=1 Tax=Hypsibius exemplaris TaxID=2072580 RepID=A0A9X6NF58_HYPEX|nr:hypothetical protein BV898_16068 [Hypsibius exemplaris]
MFAGYINSFAGAPACSKYSCGRIIYCCGLAPPTAFAMEFTLSEGEKGDKEPLQRDDPTVHPGKDGAHPCPPEGIARTTTGDKLTDMQSTSSEEKHRTQQANPY